MLKYVKLLQKKFSSHIKNTKISNIQSIQRIRPLYELPYVEIDREIHFNKNGLYLVAKEKSHNFKFYLKKWNVINLVLVGFILSSFPLNLAANICLTGIFVYLMKFFKNKHAIEVRIFNTQIGKIYLAKNMKDVVLYFPFEDSYKTFDIKSFHLVNEETFERNINIYALPISHTRYNEYSPLYLPCNLEIYDREIFCSIFRGYPLQIKLNKEKITYSVGEIQTT